MFNYVGGFNLDLFSEGFLVFCKLFYIPDGDLFDPGGDLINPFGDLFTPYGEGSFDEPCADVLPLFNLPSCIRGL